MIWKRERPTKELPPRVRKLDTHSLIMWMDTTVMNVGMAFDGWRYHDKSMDQVSESIDVLNSLWEEICSREIDKSQ